MEATYDEGSSRVRLGGEGTGSTSGLTRSGGPAPGYMTPPKVGGNPQRMYSS